MTTVGIVGLGGMGSAMSIRLVAAGHTVIGYDVAAAANAELTANGGTPLGSPGEVAAAADAVILSLPSTQSFHDVCSGAGGLGESGRAGLAVLDTSTLRIADKERGRDALADAGITLIDATVSGNRDMILSRDLTLYASGDAAALATFVPLIDTFCRSHDFVGEFGNASLVKFILNHLVCIITCANAEAMALAMKAGLEPQQIFELVRNSGAGSRLWDIRGPMMVEEDYTSARGSFLMADKDGPIIGEFAQGLAFPAVLFQAALQMHQAGVARGLYDYDTSALCRLYEEIGGVDRAAVTTGAP